MPQTPRVRFNFKNLNVQSSVPLLGVINVVARTTKGPFEDPKDLIATPSQFTRIFGSEIVPDGSVSNIMKALEMGAKVRVSRVAGAGATYGWAKPMSVTPASSRQFPRYRYQTVLRLFPLLFPTRMGLRTVSLCTWPYVLERLVLRYWMIRELISIVLFT